MIDFFYKIIEAALTHLPGTIPFFLFPGLISTGDSIKASHLSGMVTVFVSTTGTLSLTTNANQKVVVTAKCNRVHGSNTGNGSDASCYLKYNGVIKDTCHYGIYAGSGGNFSMPIALQYTETPGAGTHDITIEGDESYENMVIIATLIDVVGT